MADRPDIVCICGSARFVHDMREANRDLTLGGVIVLAPGEIDGVVDERHKAVLDELHLRKIDLADRLLVVNPGGYIGESTRREIAYARATGKPVSFTVQAMPQLSFPATSREPDIDLGSETLGDYVLFIYPRTGRPDRPDSAEWAGIPGAKGCTAESCEFRDLAAEFALLGFRILGLSSQDTEYQREAAERLHLPYPLLSDPGFLLAEELGLDTFEFEGERLYSRATLVVRNGIIDETHGDIEDPGTHPRDLLVSLTGSSPGHPLPGPSC